jgi:hypothetical protein
MQKPDNPYEIHAGVSVESMTNANGVEPCRLKSRWYILFITLFSWLPQCFFSLPASISVFILIVPAPIFLLFWSPQGISIYGLIVWFLLVIAFLFAWFVFDLATNGMAGIQ